jgi:hypothetical protein
MTRQMTRFFNCLLIVAGISVFPSHKAQANQAATLAGTYRLVQHADSGDQSRVRLQVRLVNRGSQELHIRRITLWDFSHPTKGGTQSCSIFVHAGGFASTTQEFTVPKAEYELWKRGTRPRVVLEVGAANGRTSTQVIRLDRLSGVKGN